MNSGSALPSGFGARLVRMFATGFGLGYSPIASGTVGTLPGVALVFLVWPWLESAIAQIVLALVLSALAVPICSAGEAQFGQKDDHRIVADEYMTFPVCLIGLPVDAAHWWVLAIAFVSARAFDVLKPPPAYQSQRLPAGWGVVADDFLANLYSLAANHAIFALIQRWR